MFVSWRCAARKNQTLLPKKLHTVENAVEEVVNYATISNDDVSFGELVNKGSFSTIWKCDYKGEKAAIKIFTHKYDHYWKNEWRVYDTLGVHPCIAEVICCLILFVPFST